MTDPTDNDLDRRLRQHYRSMSPPVPERAIDGARARIPGRPARRAPLLLAAAVLGALALVSLTAVIGARPTDDLAPTQPSPSSPAGSSPSPSRSMPAYVEGQTLRATAAFELNSGWSVRNGQSLYVVEVNDAPPVPTYTVQHWGDLESGLQPETVIADIPTAEIDARTEPYRPACPENVETVLDVAGLQPFERLICFANKDLTLGPVRREEYAVMSGNPPWLAGPEGPDFFTAMPFAASGGIDVPDRTWLSVTGHFDDAGCAGDLRCRERFTVTAWEPTGRPASEVAGEWTSMATAPIGGRVGFGAVWTGSEMVIWGGAEVGLNPDPLHGAAYDPAADTWRLIPDAPIEGRSESILVWTGREVIAWGGDARVDGATYDPATDRWKRIPDAPLDGSQQAVAAWIGDRLVVVTDTGSASYDPRANDWKVLPTAPIRPRWRIAAVAGDRMVVLAFGDGATGQVEGAVLDPVTWRWLAIADVPVEPSDAGIEMVGLGSSVALPWIGNLYEPSADRWDTRLPCRNTGLGDVWTGRLVLGVYRAWDPATGACLDLPEPPDRPSEFGATSDREAPVGLWTGTEYLTWSGGSGSDVGGIGNDGVVFTPAEP